MRLQWLLLASASVLWLPQARAQDAIMKDAVIAQQQRAHIQAEAAFQRRLDRKLVELTEKFLVSARADGLKFEDVVTNIGLRNANMAEFGLPLQVIRREVTDDLAVTSRAGESRPRLWISLSGTSPDTGIDLTAIDAEVVTGTALDPFGGIDVGCRYRVVLANDGERDDRGRDDYAKSYPCIQFLTGELDYIVVADLKRWAADLVKRTAQ